MSAETPGAGVATTGPLDSWGTVHLIGVGGAGMSVVAALLVAQGLDVQGSDARGGASLDALGALGVRVWVGHDAAHVAGAATVVVSSAVRESNPELVAARSAGARVLHRSEALAALMSAAGRGVAVAGAHGKTTTSAMVAVALNAAGLDPSYAIGGSVLEAGDPARPAAGGAAARALAGARAGGGDVFVAEADESDGSFLNYAPTIAVVTNVEPDHLDHYGTAEAFAQAFVDFVDRIEVGGALVACADDAGAARLVDEVAGRVRTLTYGTAPGADVRVLEVEATQGVAGVVARLRTGHPDLVADGAASTEITLDLAVPGAHNALNAAAAWTTARLLGVAPRVAAEGLGRFRGTGRRFEERGVARGVRVVDDYAHHPTEVEALLRAARPVAGEGRVLVLFQPHLFSRTRTFALEFSRALALADVVVVTDVYAAREDVDPEVTGATIVDQPPTAARADVEHVPGRLEAARRLASLARPGDLLLTVGAGDVTELGAVVLAELEGRDR